MSEETIITLKVPKRMDLIRLQFTKDGWEAAVSFWKELDRWEQEIPSVMGYGFKARTPQQAIEKAVAHARDQRHKVKSLRNNKPDPRVKRTPEEQLLAELGL